MPARWLRRGYVRGSDVAIGALSVAALAVAFVLVLHPPASSDTWARAYAAKWRAFHEAAAAARHDQAE
jgi:hypothetical protein